VIGSRPAAIAAAQQPTRAGHALTVFERDDAPGGLLRRGIPEFKLEKRRFLCLVSKTRSRNQPKIWITIRYRRRRDTNRDPARTRSSSQAAGHGPCVET
jgi:NADPH-dependent glutamate synthase beta subunit-like oxidoreductase